MKTWLLVDSDGTEKITNKNPFRAENALDNLIVVHDDGYNMYRDRCVGVWADDYSNGYFSVPRFSGVVLPKRTIKCLIGKELTWGDEPYSLEDNLVDNSSKMVLTNLDRLGDSSETYTHMCYEMGSVVEIIDLGQQYSSYEEAFNYFGISQSYYETLIGSLYRYNSNGYKEGKYMQEYIFCRLDWVVKDVVFHRNGQDVIYHIQSKYKDIDLNIIIGENGIKLK